MIFRWKECRWNEWRTNMKKKQQTYDSEKRNEYVFILTNRSMTLYVFSRFLFQFLFHWFSRSWRMCYRSSNCSRNGHRWLLLPLFRFDDVCQKCITTYLGLLDRCDQSSQTSRWMIRIIIICFFFIAFFGWYQRTRIMDTRILIFTRCGLIT